MVVKVLSHMTTNNTKEYETFKKMVSNESFFFSYKWQISYQSPQVLHKKINFHLKTYKCNNK